MTGTRAIIAVDKVGNKIRFYDPATLQETKRLDVPEPAAHELTIAYDRLKAYVPLYGDGVYGNNKKPNNKILVIDLGRQELEDTIVLGENVAPHGIVATRDGKLWVSCDAANKLLLVDPTTKQVEAAYEPPSKSGSHFIAMLPDESKLYVSNKEGDLLVFDVKERKFIASVPLRAPGVQKGNGSGSEGLTVRPDGRQVLVIDNDRSDIRVVDTATDKEIDRVPLSQNAFTNVKRSRLAKLMFSPDAKHLIVTASASGLAWVIDGSDYRKQTLIPVAKGPQGITFAPDGRTALVSSHDSGLLTRIDLEAKRAVSAHDGGTGIEVLAYY